MQPEKNLQQWIQRQCGQFIQYQALVPDASTRRYYRVSHADQSWVVMDASQDPSSCERFIKIAHTLRDNQIHAPQIYAEDLSHGWILLEDLGDHLILRVLQHSPEQADSLYQNALNVISQMQMMDAPSLQLPLFDETWFWQEWQWFKEWCLHAYLQIPISHEKEKKLDAIWDEWVHELKQQPYVFMHRDFHSQNMLQLNENQLGILDFQDAFYGPFTYDIVSLVYDCYIDWPHQQVQHWLKYYYELPQMQDRFSKLSFAEFLKQIRIMGIQRHCKAAMTFTRKKIRDQDARYLQYLPRTFSYLKHALQEENNAMTDFFAHQVIPVLQKKLEVDLCAP